MIELNRKNCCCGQGRICPTHGDSTPNERTEEKININEPKPLTPELILIGTIVKKFGANGFLEFNLDEGMIINSVNVQVKNNKVVIYAE